MAALFHSLFGKFHRLGPGAMLSPRRKSGVESVSMRSIRLYDLVLSNGMDVFLE
jgi:hypothetical protein